MSLRHKALVYYGPKDVRVETKELSCGPADLILKVHACGRCGTDIRIYYDGRHEVDKHAPIVLGHEIGAEIAAVGPKVRDLVGSPGIGYLEGVRLTEADVNFKEGDRVTVQSQGAYYRDGLLCAGDPFMVLSFYEDAGYAQYMRLSDIYIRSGAILRLPDSVTYESAPLIEPAACALHSIHASVHAVRAVREGPDRGRYVFDSGIKPGGTVGIIGSGSLALIYAKLCRIVGAEKVILFVRSDQKEHFVRSILGTDGFSTIKYPRGIKGEALNEDIVRKVSEATHGNMLDDVVCACADPDAASLAFDVVNEGGYVALFAGLQHRQVSARLDTLHYKFPAKAGGTSGCSTDHMKTIIELADAGMIDLESFASKDIFYLEDLEDNPGRFFEYKGLKPILSPHIGDVERRTQKAGDR